MRNALVNLTAIQNFVLPGIFLKSKSKLDEKSGKDGKSEKSAKPLPLPPPLPP